MRFVKKTKTNNFVIKVFAFIDCHDKQERFTVEPMNRFTQIVIPQQIKTFKTLEQVDEYLLSFW